MMNTTGRVAVMKTGLNDASVIIWAISEFFSSFFGILTNIYDIYNCNLRNTQQERQQQQKWVQTMPDVCLGHK